MIEKDNTEQGVNFSGQITLVALGVLIQSLKLLKPIEELVKIKQKSVKYSPYEKLVDALIAILSGAKSLVEVNTRVRPDEGVQKAFGRNGCAEQSVIQETLSAANDKNVNEMALAVQIIFQGQAQAVKHDYGEKLQILDIDFTGLPCGEEAEQATKGYFPGNKEHKGRQLGRVLATRYEEVVVDQLFAGNVQLSASLPSLITAAEGVLKLTSYRRQRTLVRMDSGGGSVANLNWLLTRGYQLHTKEYNARQAATEVKQWFVDPANPRREFGWLPRSDSYLSRVNRLGVRCRKLNGQWRYGIIASTLTTPEVAQELGIKLAIDDLPAIMRAYALLYDQRGGGVETEFKQDKQALGIHKRNKKKFAAQQMVMLLNSWSCSRLVV